MRRFLLFTALVLAALAYAWQAGYIAHYFPGLVAEIPTSIPSRVQSEQTHPPGYWKKFKMPTEAELRIALTPLQYTVTQEQGTERAYSNAYWQNEDAGIYVDLISGEPLFSSLDKYDSNTGWPSFTKPIDPGAVVLRPDKSLGQDRIEVRSKFANSHLGHLFDDGPAPSGARYCMNSAAMRFIPKARLEVEGYGMYANLFK